MSSLVRSARDFVGKTLKFSSRGVAPHPTRAHALDPHFSPCRVKVLRSFGQRHYPCGKAGRERFRDDRNQWYFDRTGKHLSDAGSSTKQQGEAFDLLARNYRMRGDRNKGKERM